MQATGVPASCGYGVLNTTSWPYGALLSVRSTATIVKGLPHNGCGACFQITCSQPGQASILPLYATVCICLLRNKNIHVDGTTISVWQQCHLKMAVL